MKATDQTGANPEPEKHIWVTSNYGHRTQKPFVEVSVNGADWSTQMSPDEARDLAANLLQCAEAAETDAFLMSYFRGKLGLKDPKQLAMVLIDFREWRDKQREGGD